MYEQEVWGSQMANGAHQKTRWSVVRICCLHLDFYQITNGVVILRDVHLNLGVWLAAQQNDKLAKRSMVAALASFGRPS